MRKSTLLAVFCLVALPGFSQLDFGVKGGFNLTNISADVMAGDYRIVSNPGSKFGYHAGAFLRATLFGLYIQPELLFTSVASEFSVTEQGIDPPVELIAKQRIGRIDLPVIVGVRLGTLRLGAGPVGSIIVSDNSELTDLTTYETSLKSATIGYQLGIGLDVWKAGFDVRYEGNLSKLGDQIDAGGIPVEFDSRAKQVILSLSFRF
jgi:hypothetical protein